MPTDTDIIPLGSSCAACGRSNGERHGTDCVIGSALGRMRVRVAAALSLEDANAQARETMTLLADAAADSDDDAEATCAMMTLAEAQDAYQHLQTEEATSLALDGIETLFGRPILPDAIVRSASSPTLSATTLALATRCLEDRRAELALQAGNVSGDWAAEYEAELAIVRHALAELAAVSAVTTGTAAC